MSDGDRKTMLQMVDEFQCPGCLYGPNTSTCGSFKLGECQCVNHKASTFIMGIGRTNLGLPKGFNRVRLPDGAKDGYTNIRLFPNSAAPPTWDHINMPLWALELDGFLFVRTAMPRIDTMTVDVIKGGTLVLVPTAQDVSKFINDIDYETDHDCT